MSLSSNHLGMPTVPILRHATGVGGRDRDRHKAHPSTPGEGIPMHRVGGRCNFLTDGFDRIMLVSGTSSTNGDWSRP